MTKIKFFLKYLFGFTKKRNKIIKLEPHLIKGGVLLEIGCAEGSNLLKLKEQGWGNLFGIELSELAVQRAHSKGLNVECGRVENILVKFPDNYFDVIISSMVFEHLVNPFSIIRLIAKKLKSGGQLMFSTINRKSLDALIYKKFWAGYDLPRHLVFFQKSDIRDALHNEFFRIKILCQIAPIDFLRSSEWRSMELDKKFDRLILNRSNKILSLMCYISAFLGFATRI